MDAWPVSKSTQYICLISDFGNYAESRRGDSIRGRRSKIIIICCLIDIIVFVYNCIITESFIR